jgi:acyl carrier protein
MTRDEFLRALEQALMLDAERLQPGVALAEVPEWDSLGVVEFQSLVDESFGIEMQPERIISCNSVDDLVALVAEKLTG